MDALLPPELLCDAPWSEEELDAIASGTEVEARSRDLAHDEQAAWAMAEVAMLEQTVRDLTDKADAYTDRIAAWLDLQRRPMMNRAAFLTERLERYALAVRERDGVKTLRLPSGDVSTTSQAAKVVVTGDEKLLLAWLHPRLTDAEWEDVANVTVTLRISELRKLLTVTTDADGNPVVQLTADSAVVPEVGVTPAAVSPKVKPQPGMAVARSA